MITKLQSRDPVMLGKWEISSGDTGISLGGENRTDLLENLGGWEWAQGNQVVEEWDRESAGRE